MFSEKDANFTGITGTTDDNQIFVNDFTQTTSIDMDCDSKIENYYSCNELLKEAEGFVLDSQFIFIVFQNNTKTPLLIGKITDPYQAKPIPGKQTTCKIPNVENGFVVDSVLDEKIQSGSTVEVDVTQVLVKCNAGYDLQILERTQDRACTSYGWDGVFPKCQSNN